MSFNIFPKGQHSIFSVHNPVQEHVCLETQNAHINTHSVTENTYKIQVSRSDNYFDATSEECGYLLNDVLRFDQCNLNLFPNLEVEMLLVEFYSPPQQGGSTFCACACPVTWKAPSPFAWHLKEPSFTQETRSAGQFSRMPSTPQPLQEAWHRPWKEQQCQQLTSEIHRFVFLYSRPSPSSDVAASSLFLHYRILNSAKWAPPWTRQNFEARFKRNKGNSETRLLELPGTSGNLSSLTQSYSRQGDAFTCWASD